MTYTLRRSYSGPGGTIGILYGMDNLPICLTLEDPWKNNQPNESCIPTGTYPCIPHNGPRFANVWEVASVPGRSAVLIHNGNTVSDTKGCILVGESFGQLNGRPAVLNSVLTLNRLRKLLPQNFTLVVA